VITLADQARDARQWELAVRYYQTALYRNPKNPPIWVQYGHVLREAGHLAEAERAYRTALTQGPANPDSRLQLGRTLKIQGKIEKAQAEFLRAIAIDPSLNLVWLEFMQLGWPKAFVSEFRRLLDTARNRQITPQCVYDTPEPVTHSNYGRKIAPGKSRSLYARLSSLISRSSLKRRGPSGITLADRARDTADWETAVHYYKLALKRNHRRPEVWVQYGHVLKESGNLAEAEAAYRRALAYDPTVADTHLQLGHTLKLRGKFEEAEAAYLRACVRQPSLPQPQDELTRLGWSEVNLAELRGMLQGRMGDETFDGSSSCNRGPVADGGSSADIAVPQSPPRGEECIIDDSETLKLYIERPEIADGSAELTIRCGLLIEGWALARSGVASIDLALNGDFLTSAHYGMPRLDVAKAYPNWANSEYSGFVISIPGQLLPKGHHAVHVTLRGKSGNTRQVDFRIDVAECSDDGLKRKISQAEIDLQQRILSGLNWHPKFCLLMAIRNDKAELTRATATLASVREQAYSDWHVFIKAAPRQLQTRGGEVEFLPNSVLAALEGVSDRVEILRYGEAQQLTDLASRFGESVLFGLLAAGDELGKDALLEFAVTSGMYRDADFFYSDELRISPVSKAVEPFLKPQWSPDLLLSTNYVGHLWFATAELLGRTGATSEDVVLFGEYDLVLRLTEAARAIRHIPELLCSRGDQRLDCEVVERRALERALTRRGIEGEVLATCVSGTYRTKRNLACRELVSIIIPTRASRGLIHTCIESLRNITAYRNFEIICIDNIPDEEPESKRWLSANADKVMEIGGPFNWSRFNNRAVERASGEFLLFLNDDTEIIEPDWLGALVEHGQRREVGVVGPRLLYPDRRVQHAGMFLTNEVGVARHAFRNLTDQDPGYFGLALTQRNVIAVTGACLLTRREVFERIGGFEEAHHVVNNDLDFCLKAWRRNLLIVFTPHAQLIHHERGSRGTSQEDYDSNLFQQQWRATFGDGDPYHHPKLSKEVDRFWPEPEPVRLICPSGPLLKRDTIRRILIVKLDHIGDCITALPAARQLKRVFPQASLRVLAGQWAKPIWSLADEIDEVIEFDFFRAVSDQGTRGVSEAELRTLRQKLAPYHFDLAIDLRRQPDTRQVLQYTDAGLLAGFELRGQFPWLDIAVEWGEDIARKPKRHHVSDELLNLVNAIDTSCEPAPLILPPQPSLVPLLPEPIERRLFARRVVCVHPAAGGKLRQWPADWFAELIDLLVERERVNVALVGVSDDKKLAAQILRACRHRWAVVDLVGHFKLADLANFMTRCALFVGNNSGPHHLAAGLGVPTVGIHSANIDTREWGPVGPRAIALRREMECGPCYLTNPADCHRNVSCLAGLRPRDVHLSCKRLLAIGAGDLVRESDCVPHTDGSLVLASGSHVGSEELPSVTIADPSNTDNNFRSPPCPNPGTFRSTAQGTSDHFDAEWYLLQNPDVGYSGMDLFEHFLRYGRKEGRKPNRMASKRGNSLPVTNAEIWCFKEPSFLDEVALLVTHSPQSRLKPHVPYYIDALRRHGIAVVLIVAADAPFTPDHHLVDAIDGIFIRQNAGYDFAAWAHVLRLRPELFSANILYLLNDSVIGPTNDESFDGMLRRLRNSPADLNGVTESYERGWHIQSYFIAVRSSALSSIVFQKFVESIVSYDDKDDVIDEYEVRLASMLAAAGFNCEVIFRAIDFSNPTLYHWKQLMRSGFPFIKMMLIRDDIPTVDSTDWREVLGAEGFDVAIAERALAEELRAARRPDP
jgi:ADP-heptose:LPS heptosyltransferase/GT2 family glycosyltransferase/tetratricopeptide (TPR) repeat protein